MIRQVIYFSKPYIFQNWANNIFSAWYEFSFTLLYITKCYEMYFLAFYKAIQDLLLTDIPKSLFSAILKWIFSSALAKNYLVTCWMAEKKKGFLLCFCSHKTHWCYSDFLLQESGEYFALRRAAVFAEVEQLSVSDVNRLVPEKVFAISSLSSGKTSLHIRNKAQQNRGDRSCNL